MKHKSQKIWFASELECPVDFGWEMLLTAVEAANRCRSIYRETTIKDECVEALAAAKAIGWEGDGVPHVCLYPVEGDCDLHYLFIVKQSNNGTTYAIARDKRVISLVNKLFEVRFSAEVVSVGNRF